MVKLGRRVTVKHNRAMAARLIEVAKEQGEDVARAYLRLAMRGTTCRVTRKSFGYVTLRVRGSKEAFIIPAGAVSSVKGSS